MCTYSAAIKEKALEEGRLEGRIEGRIEQLLEQVVKKLSRGKTLDVIVDEIESTPEEIEPLVNFVMRFAPEYNLEQILDAWKLKQE